MKIEKEIKEIAKRDAKLLNKKDLSDYVRFLLEIGHMFAITQTKKKNSDEYLITEEKLNIWLDKRLGTNEKKGKT